MNIHRAQSANIKTCSNFKIIWEKATNVGYSGALDSNGDAYFVILFLTNQQGDKKTVDTTKASESEDLPVPLIETSTSLTPTTKLIMSTAHVKNEYYKKYCVKNYKAHLFEYCNKLYKETFQSDESLPTITSTKTLSDLLT